MYPNETMDLCGILQANPYPGRGLMMGVNQRNEAVMLYFIMGRSDNSRNRVFLRDGDGLRIEPYDASLVKDPSLIIYRPVRKLDNTYIVTNGDQTDTIYDFLRRGSHLSNALLSRSYEPDAPNYTPRISSVMTIAKGDCRYTLSILKKQDDVGVHCARQYFEYRREKGLGHFIHTYEGDGSPLPSFRGEPARIALREDVQTFAQNAWDSLHPDNRIALYARAVPLDGGKETILIFNRFAKEDL